MSNMQNLDAALAEKERQQRVYDRAMAKIAKRDQEREGESLTIIFAWDAFGEELKSNALFAKAGKCAEFFCIGFAFLAPVLLFMAYAF